MLVTKNKESNAQHSAQPSDQITRLSSLVCGQEHYADQDLRTVYHAISGEAVYQVSSYGIDTKALADLNDMQPNTQLRIGDVIKVPNL